MTDVNLLVATYLKSHRDERVDIILKPLSIKSKINIFPCIFIFENPHTNNFQYISNITFHNNSEFYLKLLKITERDIEIKNQVVDFFENSILKGN